MKRTLLNPFGLNWWQRRLLSLGVFAGWQILQVILDCFRWANETPIDDAYAPSGAAAAEMWRHYRANITGVETGGYLDRDSGMPIVSIASQTVVSAMIIPNVGYRADLWHTHNTWVEIIGCGNSPSILDRVTAHNSRQISYVVTRHGIACIVPGELTVRRWRWRTLGI